MKTIIIDGITYDLIEHSKDNNSGDYNTGDYNPGDYNSGNHNSGNHNSGDHNSGYHNSDDYNSGHHNSGSYNSGDHNYGDHNAGYHNSGYYNSGDHNAGYCNSGHYNSGRSNTGAHNSGDYNTGMFNTDTPFMRMFNRSTDIRVYSDEMDAITFPEFLYFSLTEWVYSREMTEQEKQEHPHHETTEGYLKTFTYKEAFRKSWDATTDEDRRLVLDLPNFDNDIFLEISGIDVHTELGIAKLKE